MAAITIKQSLWEEVRFFSKRMQKKPEWLAEIALRAYLDRLADEDLLQRSEEDAKAKGLSIRHVEAEIRRKRKKGKH